MDQRKVFERYFREHEERAFFATIKQYSADIYARRDYWMFMLIRQTGMRVGSVTKFLVSDARETLRTHRLVVRAEINKGANGKKRSYEIPANKKALQSLRELLKVRRDMGLNEDPDGFLLIGRNRSKKSISIRMVQTRMRQWCLSSGLNIEASPHWLRHTLAKRLVDRSTAKQPLLIVKHALGHMSINSTTIYTYPDKDELEQELEAAS